MSRNPKEMVLDIDGVQFTCSRKGNGEWLCNGDIGDIVHKIKFPNSGPVHVFQYVQNLVANSL